MREGSSRGVAHPPLTWPPGAGPSPGAQGGHALTQICTRPCAGCGQLAGGGGGRLPRQGAGPHLPARPHAPGRPAAGERRGTARWGGAAGTPFRSDATDGVDTCRTGWPHRHHASRDAGACPGGRRSSGARAPPRTCWSSPPPATLAPTLGATPQAPTRPRWARPPRRSGSRWPRSWRRPGRRPSGR